MHIELIHTGHVLSSNRTRQSNHINNYHYTKVNGYTHDSCLNEIHAFYATWKDTVGATLSQLLAKAFISDSVYVQPWDYFVGGGGIRFQLAKVGCGPGPNGTAAIGLPISTTICMNLNVEDAKHNGRKFYGVLAKGSCEKSRIGKEFPSELLDAWIDFGKILVKPINGWQLSVSGKNDTYPVLSATPNPNHRPYKGGRR
jgi:hypothetical protein